MAILQKLISADRCITAWMARNCIAITRIALGVIFFWFGFLKFFPDLSVADEIAAKTVSVISFGLITQELSVPVLAAWESAIGLGLIFGKFLRLTLALLFLQMIGTFLPLVLLPSDTWIRIPYAPSLEGHYILKNFVLLGAALLIGATVRGGQVIADPNAAEEAEIKQESRS